MSILDQGGRYRSERNFEDYMKMLASDMRSLTPEEREVVVKIIEDFRDGKDSPLLKTVTKNIYRSPVIDIEDWVADDYYLGRLRKNIYPALIEDLIEIFHGKYNKVLLGGSIGSGKTTLGALCMTRVLYEISMLNDPHEVYDVIPGDRIALLGVGPTKDIARDIVSNKVHNLIRQIPYFKDQFKPIKTLANEIIFPNDIWIAPGASTEAHFIGMNAYMVFLSEGNFYKKKATASGDKDYAEEIYNSALRRIESRFMQMGRIPGMIIVDSSKANEDSLTERLIKENTDNPDFFIRERSLFEVQDQKRYCGEMFRVAIGNESTASRVLLSGEPDPEGSKVIEVPVEFLPSFEKDVEKSIRDISGYATSSITPFITRREKIHEAVDKTRVHPFNQVVWHQDVNGEFLWDKLVTKNREGVWEPLLNPLAPRHIHLDLSKNGDKTALTMGHVSGFRLVSRPGDPEELLPIFTVDLVLSIKAKTNGEIIQSEIRRLIYELRDHGFFIKLISADQYQSVSILQTMDQQGFNTRGVSVDRVVKGIQQPYDVLKQALYDNRINYYKYDILIKELSKLEKHWKTGKVDHPDKGSKDAADTLAAVVQTLTDASKGVRPTNVEQAAVAAPVDEDNEAWVMNDGIEIKSNSVSDREGWRKEAEARLGYDSGAVDSKVEETKGNKYSGKGNTNFIPPISRG